MNLWDVLLLLAVAGLLALAVFVLRRARRRGNSCCGSCKGCACGSDACGYCGEKNKR